ncbi:MAG: HD domain-containing protein [Lachnospiraceae bacterium]|nr:HD domain-containing protein [Lachnospiraceae bacterium]
MDEKILKIRKNLKKKLDPFRYEHTLGVAFTCQALAMRYGFDLERAEMAGLLHDCAKRFDGRTMLEKCEQRKITVREEERRDPSLLHAKLGAWYAREKYDVDDAEILSAIACHTTGKPGMTLLDKLLYVADYIEPRRNKADNLAEMRRLAFLDLDLACLKIMEHILSYLESRDCPIDAMTVAACVDMRRAVKERPVCCPESKKEEMTNESTGKRNGKNCRRRSGGEERRRYKNY